MHKDDEPWVKKQIMKLETPKMRQETLAKYKASFWQAHDKEPLPHKKDGVARFTANNRLRLYIDRVTGNSIIPDIFTTK